MCVVVFIRGSRPGLRVVWRAVGAGILNAAATGRPARGYSIAVLQAAYATTDVRKSDGGPYTIVTCASGSGAQRAS